MRTSTKLFLMLAIGLTVNSSCAIGSISDMVANVTEEQNGDAILLTSKTYPVASIKALKVATSGGSIQVSGDANSEAIIQMYVRPNNNRKLSQNEIEEILERDYEISIEERNGTLEAIAKRKNNNNWKNGISISFKVQTGNKISTDLSTSGGSIQLYALNGVQQFKTSGGSLTIDNLEGQIHGRTSGGSIKASNAMGSIDLSTSGGSIRLDELSGDIKVSTSGGSIKGSSIKGSLYASTSGGSVNLDDLNCSVRASTSGGSVSAQLNDMPGDVALSTSAGSVNLQIPANAQANLDLKGFKVNADRLTNFNGSNSKGKLVGSINGGGVQVSASTSAGSVNLSFN